MINKTRFTTNSINKLNTAVRSTQQLSRSPEYLNTIPRLQSQTDEPSSISFFVFRSTLGDYITCYEVGSPPASAHSQGDILILKDPQLRQSSYKELRVDEDGEPVLDDDENEQFDFIKFPFGEDHYEEIHVINTQNRLDSKIFKTDDQSFVSQAEYKVSLLMPDVSIIAAVSHAEDGYDSEYLWLRGMNYPLARTHRYFAENNITGDLEVFEP
ncbi:hypothetical protein KS4_18060 [Poriferisphaera corsica]|uniref:Uncharacterized protein n=1 Tax=Poriferisphaera corsica TaxID=2528020 RepID=A0A517YU64_9BACT|nr:hypothetical protein [Poriferisphaera corsica]QDU33749.1 hypothetical protein KS4_18060 [Poriferisphaera corsica]